MAFISLKDFFNIWYFKLVGLIGPRAVSERVNVVRLTCVLTINVLLIMKVRDVVFFRRQNI
jgi:hypothetical protein